MPEDWQRIEPTTQVKAAYRSLFDKSFVMPDGQTHIFTTIHPAGASAAFVIALTLDEKVIVARQYRPGPERIMDELPGGAVEPGETPEVAARRELREETGYVADALEYLGSSVRDGYSNAVDYNYLALDCQLSEDGQELDEQEYIEPVLMTIDEFLHTAKAGNITDQAAVLFAYDKLCELRDNRRN